MGSQTPPPFKSPYAPPGVAVDTRKLIHFRTDGVQPPSAVYVDVNDSLLIELQSADNTPTFLMRYRILNPSGEIINGQEQFTYTAAIRTIQIFTSQLTEGFLLSLEIGSFNIGSEISARGLTRCRIRILRGALGTGATRFLGQTLIQGMVDSFCTLTWPFGLIEPTAAGQGYIRSVVGTTPAAGAEVTETVPTAARWRLQAFQASLTTSATVANRGVTFIIDDGVNGLFQIEAPSSQVASTAKTYNWGAIGSRNDAVFGPNVSICVPPFVLAPGYRFRTFTTNIQVGDQWSIVHYGVEEWFSK